MFRGLPSCLRLIYDSSLFLAFCFCSLFTHVAASLICIFLVSSQLVEISALPKVNFFCRQKVCIVMFFWKTSSQLMSVVLHSFVWGSKFRFHTEERVQPKHYILIFEDSWTKAGLTVLFKIHSIWEYFDSICWNVFHFHSTFHNWNIQNSSHMLPTMILHLDGSCCKDAIVSGFFGNIYITKSFAIFYNLNTTLYKLSSVSAIMIRSSAKWSVYSCSDS